MPVTGVTTSLLGGDYVRGEWLNHLKPVIEDVAENWKSVLVCDEAIVEPVRAWRRAGELGGGVDAGLSLAWIYRFIAGRAGDRLGELDVVEKFVEGGSGGSVRGGGGSECGAHAQCQGLGLIGNCCPTNDGTFLGCC